MGESRVRNVIIQDENRRRGGLAESEGWRRAPVGRERGWYRTKQGLSRHPAAGVYAAPVLKLTGWMTSERKSTDLKFRLGRAAPGD